MTEGSDPRWQQPALQGAYVRLFLALMREHGFDSATLLREAGIHAAQLQGDGLLPFAPVHALIVTVLRLSDRPWLGLELGARIHAGSHGPVGLAALASGSVAEALQSVQRFAPLRSRLLDIQLHDDGTQLHLCIAPAFALGGAERFILDAAMALCDGLLCALTGGASEGAQWSVPFAAPAWQGFYRQCLAHSLQFSAPRLCLHLSKATALTRCIHADPVSLQSAQRECEQRLADGEPGRAIAAAVRRVLASSQGATPDSARMAQQLGFSQRSLFRKLKAAGMGWQALVDSHRREQAQWLLQASGHRIENIAERLGYSDASNFARDCRRWSGLSPRVWREQLRHADLATKLAPIGIDVI